MLKIGCALLFFGTLAYLLILGWILLFLWNIVVPGIFNGPGINYFQSLALVLFIWLLANLVGTVRTMGK